MHAGRVTRLHQVGLQFKGGSDCFLYRFWASLSDSNSDLWIVQLIQVAAQRNLFSGFHLQIRKRLAEKL